MQDYEQELDGIIREYLSLYQRILTWQKSLPAEPQRDTPMMGLAMQYRLNVKRPEMFMENLDLIQNRQGGLQKFLSEEQERDPRRVCKTCGADISALHHWAKYCDEHNPKHNNTPGGLL